MESDLQRSPSATKSGSLSGAGNFTGLAEGIMLDLGGLSFGAQELGSLSIRWAMTTMMMTAIVTTTNS